MDELRKEFERLHPVPEGIEWDGERYSRSGTVTEWCHAINDRWQGFQSGYAAGMERAELKWARRYWHITKNMDLGDLADYDDELASEVRETREEAHRVVFGIDAAKEQK